jgi:hypothetical protein
VKACEYKTNNIRVLTKHGFHLGVEHFSDVKNNPLPKHKLLSVRSQARHLQVNLILQAQDGGLRWNEAVLLSVKMGTLR